MKRTDITALFPDATEDQINQIMNLNGADINKVKGDLTTLQGQLGAAQAQIQQLEGAGNATGALQTKITDLQNELNGMKQAEALRNLRAKVAAEKKIPADLLTGETEEACAAQADAILTFAKSSGYPAVQDGGEVHDDGKPGKDAAWQRLAAEISKKGA